MVSKNQHSKGASPTDTRHEKQLSTPKQYPSKISNLPAEVNEEIPVKINSPKEFKQAHLKIFSDDSPVNNSPISIKIPL